MRGIIAGAGGMGRAWGANLRDNFPEVEVVAWVDLDRASADRAIADHGFRARAFTSIHEAIGATGAEILVNVTIPEAHESVTLAAIEAGLDVIVEKPLAHSLEAARRMVGVAESKGRTLMVSQNRRFDPNLFAFHRLVADEIGSLGLLTADFFIGAHFGGFRDEMAHVLLLDMAIHTFDAARAISGRDAVSVYAEEFNPSWSWYAGASGATCLFEMDGGARFEYRGLWSAEGASTSWNAAWRAVGAEGTALFDGDSAPRAEVVAERGGFQSRLRTVAAEATRVPSGIEGTFAEFLAARREGRAPVSSARGNFNSLAMVFGAIASASIGRRVAIERI